ncbi:hypothetical protein K0817_013785 [Microbacterium sp. HD4P20]|uniref:hypothetical protein n=1 Tax=Microbacterium sp. HD4P20 TaxID=2864874 RepID=UPI0020A49F92|nr:hypothetical protein [Microbacterium sp. HD4P20]MCP2637625.1 hypothetical protein [Microbacterium sp. HD4P20]
MSDAVTRWSEALAPRAHAVQRALGSAERTPRMAVVIGRLLGAGMLVCLLTGVYSHLLQDPSAPVVLPTRPVELYQWSQGTHVMVGTALMPLLLAKLWVVYPRLFRWPPVRSIVDLAERASIAVLVSASLVQVTMGLLNTFQWYPWPFSFRGVHWALAWVIVGALVVHVGVKLPLIARHWTRAAEARDTTEHETDASA